LLEAIVAPPRPAGLKQAHERRVIQTLCPDAASREPLDQIRASGIQRPACVGLVE
jgi:hypothetical protein